MEQPKATCEPAYTVIKLCGGNQRVADICGLADRTTPYRWCMPLPYGRGGVIPLRRAKKLLEWASANNVPLEWSDVLPANDSVVKE